MNVFKPSFTQTNTTHFFPDFFLGDYEFWIKWSSRW